ncbi:MAG: SpoIID/LytB domain-containing protein, partial [bacterium]
PVRFGLEALKAQAIAARNYVLLPRTKAAKEFDVDDSVASQVYFGASTESELSNKAVEETEELVALYDWELILAQYSSTAGGYTENYENAFSDPKTKDFPPKSKPYLQGRPDIYNVAPLNREEEARLFYMSYPDSYDMKSPYYRWQKEFSREELEKVLSQTLIAQSKTGFVKPEFKQGDTLGELKELRVKRRGVSGKIMELEIVTDKATYSVFKELVIRRLLQKDGISLPSANVVFENLYDSDKKLNKIVAYGGGFGHGVGMSQYGAGFMSTSLHKTFDKILKRYYTGITISTVPIILSSDDAQKITTQNFFATEKKAFLMVDNKYQIEKFNANINGCIVAFELARGIVPSHRISRIDISSYIKEGKNSVTFYFPEKNENKAIRLYIELVEKDDNEYNF